MSNFQVCDIAKDGQSKDTFANPIMAKGSDPSIIFVNGYYYCVQSKNDLGITITRSHYKNLTDIDTATDKVDIWIAPETGENSRQVWAPELHFIDGYWYVYYTATTADGNNANHRMFVLKSQTDDIMGPYVDMGKMTDEADRWAIDGSPFEYKGQYYFVWSGWGDEEEELRSSVGSMPGRTQNLYIAKMSSPTTLEGTGVLISAPTYEWERRAMAINEGPQVIIRNNKIHIIYSASGSWTDDYCYGLLTNSSDNLLDINSWVKSPKPMLVKTETVFGPGHGTFTASPDETEDWMIYHTARSSGAGWDRMIFAQRFTWNEDGTPNFGHTIGPGVIQAVPSGQISIR